MSSSSTPILSDYQLFKAFKRGEKEAFREIYLLFVDRIRKSLLYKVGNTGKTIPDSEVDDMISEAFYRLFIHREVLANMDHLRGYLFKTSKTLFVDLFRERKRKIRLMNEGYFEQEWDEQPIRPMEDFALKQMKSFLDKHTKILVGQQRLIFEMFFFDNKNTNEIAKITGKNKQTVLNQKTIALGILRKAIGMQMTEEGPIIYPIIPIPVTPKPVQADWKSVGGWKKPVRCKESGVEYSSVSEAAKHLKCQVTSIIKVLKNQYTNTHGYTFEYV